MNWTKPSLDHFRYIRSLPMTHLPSGLDFSIRQTLLGYLYSGAYKKVYVAGYSLGGTLAIGAIQDLGYHIDRDKLNVQVFGIAYNPARMFCPGKTVKKAVENRLLIAKTHWDPIVHLPCHIMARSWTLRLKPLRIIFGKPAQWISFWADYGRIEWIGSILRPLPIQHYPDQVERALKEYEAKK